MRSPPFVHDKNLWICFYFNKPNHLLQDAKSARSNLTLRVPMAPLSLGMGLSLLLQDLQQLNLEESLTSMH